MVNEPTGSDNVKIWMDIVVKLGIRLCRGTQPEAIELGKQTSDRLLAFILEDVKLRYLFINFFISFSSNFKPKNK